MSKIKGHTPGPWRYAETSGRDGGQLTPESVTVFSLSDAELAPCRAYGDTLEQMWANARLIAAAPDLLAALKRIRDARDYFVREGVYPEKIHIQYHGCFDDWAADLADAAIERAAIARATVPPTIPANTSAVWSVEDGYIK